MFTLPTKPSIFSAALAYPILMLFLIIGYTNTLFSQINCNHPNPLIQAVVDPNDNLTYTFSVTNLSIMAFDYHWTFSTNDDSYDESPDYTFPSAGTYQICVDIELEDTCQVTACLSLVIPATGGGGTGHCPTPIAQADQIAYCGRDTSITFDVLENDTYTGNPVVSILNFPNKGRLVHGSPYTGVFTFIPHNLLLFTNDAFVYIVQDDCGADTIRVDIVLGTAAHADFTVDESNRPTISFTPTDFNALVFHWDFGDGDTSSLPNPTHTYLIPGFYTVCLTTTSPCSEHTVCKQVEATIPCGTPAPNIVQAVSIQHPLEFNFSTYDPSGTIWLTYEWTFPDGSTSNLPNPIYTFATAGTHEVCLRVTGINGCTEKRCTNVTVSNPNCDAPTAVDDTMLLCLSPSTLPIPLDSIDIDVTQNDLLSGNAVTMSVLQSHGDITGQAFFPSPHDGTLRFRIRSLSPSTNTITYQVCDSCGCDTAQVVIYSKKEPFITEITHTPPEPNGTVTFTADGLHANAWHWDFGDGFLSNDENPTHTYGSTAIFYVSVTVSNECGMDSDGDSLIITQICDPPELEDDEISMCHNTSQTINVAENDDFNEPDPTQLSVRIVSGPSHGTYTFNPNTYDLTYTPQAHFTGQDQIVYEVSSACESDQATVSIEVENLPNPIFQHAPVQGQARTIAFTTIDNDAHTAKWNFGDETPEVSAFNTTHQFPTPGTYDVSLTKTNSCGGWIGRRTVHIPGPCPDPIAKDDLETIAYEANQANTTMSLSLINNDTHGLSPRVRILNMKRVDGNNEVTVPVSLQTTTSVGAFNFVPSELAINNSCTQYVIKYELCDVCGCDEGIANLMIGPAPEPSFSVTAHPTDPPSNKVDIKNTSKHIDSYAWSFGDGTTSNQAFNLKTHEYPQAGAYTIKLIGTNQCGTRTKQLPINVNLCNLPVALPDQVFACLDPQTGAAITAMVDLVSNDDVGQNTSYSVKILKQPEFGSLIPSGNSPGVFTYTPNVANSVTEFIPYKLCTDCGCSESVLTLNITGSPIIDFSSSVQMGNTLSVDFDGSIDVYNRPHSLSWDFGDGQSIQLDETAIAALPNSANNNTGTLNLHHLANHTYASPGNYTVTLTVSNTCGTSTVSHNVDVRLLCPLPQTQSEQFFACERTSSQDEGTVFNVLLNDEYVDTPTVSISMPPIHGSIHIVPNAPVGTFEYFPHVGYTGGDFATYEVCDDCGCSTETIHFDVMSDVLPSAVTSVSVSDQTVHLTTTPQTGVTWEWDFGDGNSKETEQAAVSHTYASPGSYNIPVTATNACGTIDTYIAHAVICGRDAHEGNDDMQSAASINPGVTRAFICPQGDIDWYQTAVPANKRNLQVRLTELPQNFTLRIKNSMGATIAMSANTGTQDEEVTLNNLMPGMYYVQVEGAPTSAPFGPTFDSDEPYRLHIRTRATAFDSRYTSTTTDAPTSENDIRLTNYPNPFTEETTLEWFLPERTEVSLTIHNFFGQKIATIVNTRALSAGIHTYPFHSNHLPDGVYYAILQAGERQIVQKVVILR